MDASFLVVAVVVVVDDDGDDDDDSAAGVSSSLLQDKVDLHSKAFAKVPILLKWSPTVSNHSSSVLIVIAHIY